MQESQTLIGLRGGGCSQVQWDNSFGFNEKNTREFCGRVEFISKPSQAWKDCKAALQANSCAYVCARILKVNLAAILAIISEKAGRFEKILKALRKVSDLQKRSDPVSKNLFGLISVLSKIIKYLENS